jgi:hypothetical protein
MSALASQKTRRLNAVAGHVQCHSPVGIAKRLLQTDIAGAVLDQENLSRPVAVLRFCPSCIPLSIYKGSKEALEVHIPPTGVRR